MAQIRVLITTVSQHFQNVHKCRLPHVANAQSLRAAGLFYTSPLTSALPGSDTLTVLRMFQGV